jgi:hypothetical protein
MLKKTCKAKSGRMRNKLQTSIEFVVMLGFVLLFFSVFLLIVQGNTESNLRQKNNLIAREIAGQVQDEINLALDAGEGYYREFRLPDKIGAVEYDINLVDEMVYLNTSDGRIALALPIVNVTGNVQNGTNTVRRNNGTIFMNQ